MSRSKNISYSPLTEDIMSSPGQVLTLFKNQPELTSLRENVSTPPTNLNPPSPAMTLIKSVIRDSQRQKMSPASSHSTVTTQKENCNPGSQVTPIGSREDHALTSNNIEKLKTKRFDVSSPSALLRERNPKPNYNVSPSSEEDDMEPPLPLCEILKDLNVYAEVRDGEDNRSAGIKSILRSMGAVVHDRLNKSVTHVIFRDGYPGTYNKAKKINAHILSVLWLDAVRNAGRRIPEECYPALGLEIYETPNATKKFRRLKSMQPDYEDVREEYHHKRLEKVFRQRENSLICLESTTGKTKPSDATKSRRKTMLDESSLKVSFNSSTDNLSTSVLAQNSSMPSCRYLHAEVLHAEKRTCQPRATAKKNIRKSVLTLVPHSPEPSNAICVISPKHRRMRNRNVVVNQTMTPPCTLDFVEGSQDLNNAKLTRDSILAFKNSKSEIESSVALNDQAKPNCEDLENVLAALQNDENGTLRQRLLNGLGITVQTSKNPKITKSSSKKLNLSYENALSVARRDLDSPTKLNNLESSQPMTKIKSVSTNKYKRKLSMDDKHNENGSKRITYDDKISKINTDMVLDALNTRSNKENMRSVSSAIIQKSGGNDAETTDNEIIKINQRSKRLTRKLLPLDYRVTDHAETAVNYFTTITEHSTDVQKEVPRSAHMQIEKLTNGARKLGTLHDWESDNDADTTVLVRTAECPYFEQPSSPQNVTNEKPVKLKADLNRRRSTSLFAPGIAKQLKKEKQKQRLPSIVCTRLHGDEIAIFEQVVRKLGGFVVENSVSNRTTHLVSGGPQRTINLLRAMSRGCWILNYAWLLQSLEIGKWVGEEEYELTEFSVAVQKCRVERQTFGEPYSLKLFDDCGSIYVSESSTPCKKDLVELLKLCCASVVMSPCDAKIVVGEFILNENVTCVSEKWVLDSITLKRTKTLKRYIIQQI